MTFKKENVTRALAILTTEPDANDIIVGGSGVNVAGQMLSIFHGDDMETLAVLMAQKEFGFAVGRAEKVARTMRRLQDKSFKAAKKLNISNPGLRKASIAKRIAA